jgi:hypothetical protein
MRRRRSPWGVRGVIVFVYVLRAFYKELFWKWFGFQFWK